MLTTLTWKEARELAPLVALALLVQGLSVLLRGQSLAIFSLSNDADIPFVNEALVARFVFVGGMAALVLGLWQTLWELGRGTFQFLLHRPVERAALFNVKLTAGFVATLLISGAPILLYALWAASPGTHASPFFWSMTLSAWLTWFRLPVLYLGAFLSGLRPGGWLGTRGLPLAAALGLVVFLSTLERWPAVCTLATAAIEACYLIVIHRVAATRDYS